MHACCVLTCCVSVWASRSARFGSLSRRVMPTPFVFVVLWSLGVVSFLLPVGAIPFSAAPPPTVRLSAPTLGSGSLCLVDATSRGISSIAAGDLDAALANCTSYDQPANGIFPSAGILLGNNSLSSLPADLIVW